MEVESNHLNHVTLPARTQDAEFSRPQILGARILYEEVIRADITNQELADQQLDRLELKISAAPKSNQSSNIS